MNVTAPAAGATVSGIIPVNASASDNNGVAGVQFRLDGQALGAEDTTAPYSVNWNTATATGGSHTLTAVARDAAGNTTTSGPVNVTVSSSGPTVNITAPAAGALLRGSATVSANAADDTSVAGVQFRLDGQALGAEDTTAPYSVDWNTPTAANGSHTLTAVARDTDGNTTTSTGVNVTIDNAAPAINVSAPSAGAQVAGTVTISGSASDNNAVAGVQFRVDGQAVGAEDTSAPYSVSWNTTGETNGSHSITAVARDAAGNTTTSGGVNVTVDNAAPAVSVTQPAEGATASGTTTVTGNASDNTAVAGVQFRLDGQALGAEDTAAPYSVNWNTTSASNGSHALTAVARDQAGNSTTSSVVNVTVSNSGPPPGLVAAYAFDEGSGTTAADASGRGNPGTLLGATWNASGRFGAALNFDGVNDWVTVADSASLDLTNAMTMMAWVRPTTTGGWRTALFKEAGNDLAYALYTSGAVSGAAFPSSWIGGSDLTGSAALPTNTWTHLTATYDRANWRLYANGTQVATRAFTPAIGVSNGPLRIGGNAIWGEWFAGALDELRVYDRALSSAEVVTARDTRVGP